MKNASVKFVGVSVGVGFGVGSGVIVGVGLDMVVIDVGFVVV